MTMNKPSEAKEPFRLHVNKLYVDTPACARRDYGGTSRGRGPEIGSRMSDGKWRSKVWTCKAYHK